MALSSLVVLLFFVVVAVHGDDVTCSSACSCSGANYTIDLSSINIFPANISDSQDSKLYYIINPCNPFQCYTTTASVVCQHGAKDHNTNTYHPLSCGKADDATLTLNSYSPLKFAIKYIGGDGGRTSTITFVQGSPSPVTEQVTDLVKYDFTVTTDLSKVMQTGGASGGGGVAPGVIGIVIIILALAALITYFIGGMLFMYFVRGARGVEMVPNLVFWKDFPILIKDGFTFTFGPCVRALSREQAYEKI